MIFSKLANYSLKGILLLLIVFVSIKCESELNIIDYRTDDLISYDDSVWKYTGEYNSALEYGLNIINFPDLEPYTSLHRIYFSEVAISPVDSTNISGDRLSLSLELNNNLKTLSINACRFYPYTLRNLELYNTDGLDTLKITNTIPTNEITFFESLDNLKYADLSKNELFTIPFTEIPENLTYLNLSANEISEYQEKSEIFIVHEKLEYINLDDNRISNLALESESLKEIYISENEISELNIKCPNVIKIDCSSNRLNRLDYNNEIVNRNFTIKYLDASKNSISNISYIYSSLEILKLHENKIKYINTTNLSNLIYLDLSNNELDYFPYNGYGLQKIESLLLDDNLIPKISNDIGDLTTLKVLSLKNNAIDKLPPQIEALSNLEMLFLEENNLISLPSEIENLTNLKYLDIIKNDLTELPSEIENLTNLDSLDLHFNQLTSLVSEIGNLSNLKSLGLINNKLSSIPSEIGNLSNLEKLNLYGNVLTTIPSEIGNLSNLINLNLAWNQLTELPSAISNLTNLIYLNLEGNNFSAEEQQKIKDWLPNCTIYF